MKKPLILLLCLLASTAALAQTDDASAKVQAERQRILTERQQIENRFAQEEADCYQKFAVNGCREDSRARRRELMADLHRQEVLLNDAERKRKGAEQLQRMEQSAAQDSPPADAKPGEASVNPVRTRLPSTPRQLRDPAQAAAAQAARKATLDSKRKAYEEEQASRASRAALAGEERQRYTQKQQDAAEHAAQTRKRNAENGKPPAAPLPP